MKYSGALTPLRRWVSEARLAANKSSLRWTAAHSWHRQSIHAQTLPTSWMPCTVSPSAEWPISSCSRQACALRHHDINKLHVFYWQTKHSDIITSLGQTAIYSWTLAQYTIKPKLTQFPTSPTNNLSVCAKSSSATGKCSSFDRKGWRNELHYNTCFM